MQRCNSCVLPQTYPGIEFNEQGTCCFCASHRKKQFIGREALDVLFERQKAKQQPYDAIVGISGGRDSAYVLHQLVRVHKLKVLAYFIDNGLVPETAVLNMKNMTEAVGVDFHVDRSGSLLKCLKHNFEAWTAKPSLGFIMLTCTICNGNIEIGLRKTAKRKGISLIITGAGGVEEAHFKYALAGAGARRDRQNALGLVGNLARDLAANPRYFKSPPCMTAEGRAFLYQYLPFPLIQKLFYPDQTKVDYLDYVGFDEAEMHRVIETELGWRKPENLASPWRFDCKLAFLKHWIFMELFDFSEKDDLFSSMIREGLMTREQALERIRTENTVPLELVTGMCRETGLDFPKIQAATRRLKEELRSRGLAVSA
ncbi:hypothetical protein JW777_09215 [bacterium]|nr:hypothetical protein [bacterium]